MTPMGVWKLERRGTFRCHNKGAHIAISEEPGIINVPQCVRQSCATKTCPIPNANNYLTSAKSPTAQNVLLPISSESKSPLICSTHPAIGTCFTVGGPALGKTEVDPAVLNVLLTPPEFIQVISPQVSGFWLLSSHSDLPKCFL